MKASKRSRIVDSVEEASPGLVPPARKLPAATTPTEVLLTYLLEEIEKQPKAPEGLIFCIPEMGISGKEVVEYDLEDEPDAGEKAWFSCNILNDGDDDVYVRFNSEHGEFRRIKKNEDLTIDLHGPKLKKLFFKCAADDEEATIRILGVR
jgi:hypothetical protein